jgi:ATP-dependent Clp protease ATP-binding subunit ClpC
VELTQEAKDFIVDKGYDEKYGARPLRRMIQSHIEDLLAEAYIDNKIQDGDHLVITHETGADELKIINDDSSQINNSK